MPFFQYLISHGADVDTVSHTGEHLLHYLPKSNRLSYVKYLIIQGARINCTTTYMGHTLLHFAADRGDHSFVDFLVSNGADVNIRDGSGKSAMQLAAGQFFCSYDRDNAARSCMEYLIAHGADDVDFNKGFLIHQAASDGDLPLLECLVSHNASVNIIGDYGYPPLYSAASSQHGPQCVDYLISHGADVDMKDGWGALLHTAASRGDLSWMKRIGGTGQEKTALQVAASQGHRSCVEYLVDHGVDLNYEFDNNCDSYGNRYEYGSHRITILYTAAGRGNFAVLDFLISRGANVNIGMENIQKAVFRRYISCVDCLLTHGVDVNIISSNGNSLLHTAIDSESLPMVELLVGHGANVKTVDRDGNTPLHVAVKKSNKINENFSMASVQYLVSKGADLNVPNSIGKTALHIAAEIGDRNCVRYLVVDAEANLNDLDNIGRTALHYAAAGGHSDGVEYLKSGRGVDAHVQDMDGNTALHLAVSGKHSECARLLSYSGSLNAKNKDGNTPLHLFAINGSINCLDGITSWICSRIDFEARNEKDQTALICAILGGHSRCLRELVSKGADINAEYMGETALSIAEKWGIAL